MFGLTVENNRKKRESGEGLVVPPSKDGLFIRTELALSNSEPTSPRSNFPQIGEVPPKSGTAPTTQRIYENQLGNLNKPTIAEAEKKEVQEEIGKAQPKASAARIKPCVSKSGLKSAMELTLGLSILGVALMGFGGASGWIPLVIAGAALTAISLAIYLTLSLYHLSQSQEGITACGFFSLLKDNAMGFFGNAALKGHNPGPALSNIRSFG